MWELTTTRTFALVDSLLREAGSEERVFHLYGGQDKRASLLTHEMYESRRLSALLLQRQMPVPMPGA